MDTLGALCNDLTPSPTLTMNCRISCCGPTELSAIQKTAGLQDHPGLGSNKPSILTDQLIALKQDTLDNVIKALFFRKMP